MGRQPNFGTPIAFGLILMALIIGYFDYSSESNESAAERCIKVEGVATKEIKADRAFWKGRTVNEASSLQRGYASVKTDRELLGNFLKDQGFDSSRIDYEPVEVMGHSTAGRTSRYTLEQSFSLEGDDPERIGKLAEDVASLMERGVRIRTQKPHYRYSKLEEVRKELNALAVKDAKEKAEAVADSSDVSVSDLKKVTGTSFRIEGKDPEEASAPDHPLTRSLEQTLQVRLKATYSIE
jgi:hypothetical protein